MEAANKIMDRYQAVLKEDWREPECRLSEAAGLAFAFEMVTGKQITAAVRDGAYAITPDHLDGIEKALESKIITLADVDKMALETLTMAGEITITEDSPPVPSVGWPGSDEISGEIAGRFEVPAGAVIPTSKLISTEDATLSVVDYIEESGLLEKIQSYFIDHFNGILPSNPIVKLTGVTKKGDRGIVEFKVVVK